MLPQDISISSFSSGTLGDKFIDIRIGGPAHREPSLEPHEKLRRAEEALDLNRASDLSPGTICSSGPLPTSI
jgi:hypothetical protein